MSTIQPRFHQYSYPYRPRFVPPSTDIDTDFSRPELLGIASAAVLLLDRPDRGALAVGVSGIVVAVVAAWRLTDLGGVASPGIGLYLTLLAGLGLLAAGAWGYVADEGQEEPAAL